MSLSKGSIRYTPQAFRKTLKFDVTVSRAPSVCIQCKNLITKDAYAVTLSQADLKAIGFHQSVKGYFNRIKTALAGTDPELKCFFWFFEKSITQKKQKPNTGDSMALLLVQSTKFDDDLNWVTSLKPLNIKITEKLGERLEDIVHEVQATQEKFKGKLTTIVEQVRTKFDEVEDERKENADRLEMMENACKKVISKVKEFSSQLEEQKVSHEEAIVAMSKMMAEKDKEIQDLRATVERYKKLADRRSNEVDKKLIRWRSRQEFKSHQEYISYVTNMLDKWDQRFGRIFVYVSDPKGKSAAFVDRVGEPVKWNGNLCWVRWFAGASPEKVDSYSWQRLDVYLPESAYYWPRPKKIVEPDSA